MQFKKSSNSLCLLKFTTSFYEKIWLSLEFSFVNYSLIIVSTQCDKRCSFNLILYKRMVRNKSGQQLCKFIHAIYHRDGAKGEKGNPVNSTSKHNASIHYSYTGGT